MATPAAAATPTRSVATPTAAASVAPEDAAPPEDAGARTPQSLLAADAASDAPRAAYQVVVRVRPLAHWEEGDAAAVDVLNGTRLRVSRPDQCGLTDLRFDAVLGQDAGQGETFDAVQDVVLGAVDGHNGSILAYGQTGGGKTYTMTGIMDDDGSGSCPYCGIIPRSLAAVFEHTAEADLEGWQLSICFMEIYNERVYDLLGGPMEQESPRAWRGVRERGERPERGPGLEVHETRDGTVSVPGLMTVSVRTLDQAMEVLRVGTASRASGDNTVNACSSRSHAIFQIVLERLGSGGEVLRSSKLNLVDLAGSEKMPRGHTLTKSMVNELTAINTSLSALGQCINALVSSKRTHMPCRDSKLTRLLQDSFRGRSLTAMIICISPAVSSLDETFNSLKFADRAKRAVVLDKGVHEISPKGAKGWNAEAQRQMDDLLRKVNGLSMELHAERAARRRLETLFAEGLARAGVARREDAHPAEHEAELSSVGSGRCSLRYLTPPAADAGGREEAPACRQRCDLGDLPRHEEASTTDDVCSLGDAISPSHSRSAIAPSEQQQELPPELPVAPGMPAGPPGRPSPELRAPARPLELPCSSALLLGTPSFPSGGGAGVPFGQLLADSVAVEGESNQQEADGAAQAQSPGAVLGGAPAAVPAHAGGSAGAPAPATLAEQPRARPMPLDGPDGARGAGGHPGLPGSAGAAPAAAHGVDRRICAAASAPPSWLSGSRSLGDLASRATGAEAARGATPTGGRGGGARSARASPMRRGCATPPGARPPAAAAGAGRLSPRRGCVTPPAAAAPEHQRPRGFGSGAPGRVPPPGQRGAAAAAPSPRLAAATPPRVRPAAAPAARPPDLGRAAAGAGQGPDHRLGRVHHAPSPGRPSAEAAAHFYIGEQSRAAGEDFDSEADADASVLFGGSGGAPIWSWSPGTAGAAAGHPSEAASSSKAAAGAAGGGGGLGRSPAAAVSDRARTPPCSRAAAPSHQSARGTTPPQSRAAAQRKAAVAAPPPGPAGPRQAASRAVAATAALGPASARSAPSKAAATPLRPAPREAQPRAAGSAGAAAAPSARQARQAAASAGRAAPRAHASPSAASPRPSRTAAAPAAPGRPGRQAGSSAAPPSREELLEQCWREFEELVGPVG